MEHTEKGKVILGGNGAAKTKEIFSSRPFNYSSIERCHAAFFEKEIQEKFSKKEFSDLTYFEPFYLKSPAITKPKPLL
jgi:hypothetical protein